MTGDKRALPTEQAVEYKKYLRQRSETAARSVKVYAQRHSHDDEWTNEILAMLGLNDEPADYTSVVGGRPDYDF